MPELPEVETTRRGLEPHLTGHTIASLTVRNPDLRWPVAPDMARTLRGRRIIGLERRAKYLLLRLDRGTVISHLGMSGSWRVLMPGAAAKTSLRTHDHLILTLDDGTSLRYHDPRRFGCFLYTETPDSHPLLAALGPEPLGEDFDGDYLQAKSRGRKVAVKDWLMDQKIVVGVGNIYAQEALFYAGIRPGLAAGRLSRARCQRLAQEVKKLLAAAIEQGGTTLKDFLQSDGEPGYFALELAVYGRAGQPCLRCGRLIKAIPQSNRTTSYCPTCQS